MANAESIPSDRVSKSERTIEIDGEVVQLRDKEPPENEAKINNKKRSLRSSIRESFRNNALRRSLVRRAKSYEPQKERPRIKPKRSKTVKFFLSTVPRSLFNPLVIRIVPTHKIVEFESHYLLECAMLIRPNKDETSQWLSNE